MKEKDKYRQEYIDDIFGNFPGQIDVDAAWSRLKSRLGEEGTGSSHSIFLSYRRRVILQAAAVLLIIISIGTGVLWLGKTNDENNITVNSGMDERNYRVTLPDGSVVWLNRNSRLSYGKNYGTSVRNVTLRGEAFFDIRPDTTAPFIIDAGKAIVRVVGTSFNVITSNEKNEVEVFVQTGKVAISGSADSEKVIIEPGFIGTSGGFLAAKTINANANYLAWKTDTLVYEGESLDVVFSDLKKVFNINITTNDPDIARMSLSTTFFSLPHDTIIQLICNTFTLNYRKEGNVYQLSK